MKSGVHMRAKENRDCTHTSGSIKWNCKKLRWIIILRDCAASGEKGYLWITKWMSSKTCRSNMYVEHPKMLLLICVSRILCTVQTELDRPAHGPKDDCLHTKKCHEWNHFWWREDNCTIQTVTDWMQTMHVPSFQGFNEHNNLAFFVTSFCCDLDDCKLHTKYPTKHYIST